MITYGYKYYTGIGYGYLYGIRFLIKNGERFAFFQLQKIKRKLLS